MSIPKSLRVWFVLHFVIDVTFAIPLIFFTEWFLNVLGFSVENLVLARLVGAALVGIGGASLFMHRAGAETYRAMLVLKLLWSGSAIIAFVISLAEGTPVFIWAAFAIFVLFFMLWAYYFFALTLKKDKDI